MGDYISSVRRFWACPRAQTPAGALGRKRERQARGVGCSALMAICPASFEGRSADGHTAAPPHAAPQRQHTWSAVMPSQAAAISAAHIRNFYKT